MSANRQKETVTLVRQLDNYGGVDYIRVVSKDFAPVASRVSHDGEIALCDQAVVLYETCARVDATWVPEFEIGPDYRLIFDRNNGVDVFVIARRGHKTNKSIRQAIRIIQGFPRPTPKPRKSRAKAARPVPNLGDFPEPLHAGQAAPPRPNRTAAEQAAVDATVRTAVENYLGA